MPIEANAPKPMSHRGPIVVGLGEVLWDVFGAEAHFGGAPANFACHAAALGARAHMVSAVGDDAAGQRALSILRNHNVDVSAVLRVPHVPTGTVQVCLDAQGRPRYTVQSSVAWDQINWTAPVEDLALRADAVCFGTIAQRSETSRQTILRFLDATQPRCLRVFDANLRQHYFDRTVIAESLQRSTILKLNAEELAVFAELFGLDGSGNATQMSQLLERFGLQLVVLTLGERGAILRDRRHTVAVATEPVQVRDTVGAGDAFAATITVGLLAGVELQEVAQHACRVAGHVCAHDGAVPSLPPALRMLS